ncbi:MAG: globin-coupled sensor protein [Bacillaceae bacterium]|nr:globin-coupled sensor protein [Bacillaceae bacterium]
MSIFLKRKKLKNHAAWTERVASMKVIMDIKKESRISEKIEMIRFTQEDLRLIKSLEPLVKEHVDYLVKEFYDTILNVGELKEIIEEHSSVDRLSQTLKRHLIEMFNGKIDDSYMLKRRRVAMVHYKIGLQPAWYMGAFQNLQNSILNLLCDYVTNKEELRQISLSLTKLLSLEQQLVLEAYEKENIENMQRQFEDGKNHLKEKMLEISENLVALAQEMNSSVESLISDSDRVKKQMNVSSEESQEAISAVKEGQLKINELISNMGTISSDTDQMGGMVEKLEESSKRIINVISIVEEIAEKTNLLALNSAIEAARAGEHGKGFAVVAAEVRKLAEQTKESVSDIQEILSSSSSYTNRVIDSLQRVTNVVNQGENTSRETEQSFDHIVESIQSNHSRIQELDVLMNQLDEVIQEIGEASTSVTESAEKLNETANLA